MGFAEDYWEWIGAGCNVLAVYLLNKYLKSCLQHADCIKNTAEYEVGPKLYHELKNVKDNIPYVSVRGIVEPIGTPLGSRYCEDQGVIRKIYMATHKSQRTQGYWSKMIDVVKDHTEHIPFHLASDHAKDIKMKIDEPLSAQHLMDSLIVTHDHFEPNKEGLLNKTMDRLFGEIVKGFQETEKMLPIGVPMLGIGRLTLKDGKLFLCKPLSSDNPYILTTLSRTEVLNKLHGSVKTTKVMLWLFSTIGMTLLGYGIYRCAKTWIDKWNAYRLAKALKLMREEREREFQEARANGGEDPTDDENSRTQCVACMTQRREVLLLECGHVCLCGDCAMQLPQPKKCPVCRQNVDRIVPAYFP